MQFWQQTGTERYHRQDLYKTFQEQRKHRTVEQLNYHPYLEQTYIALSRQKAVAVFLVPAHRRNSTQSGTKNLASGHSLTRDYFADCHCANQDRTPALSAAPQLPADHLREQHPSTGAPPGARRGSSRAGTGTPRTPTRPPSTASNRDRWVCSAAAAADSARRPAPGPASRRAATLAGSSRRTAAAVAAAAAGRRPALRDPPTLCRRFCVTTRWGPAS